MKIQNRLAKASSPYLRQHADNPVDWYEWSEEALQKAKAEHKPLLISIGYAACHWCHVMAYESFSDYAIASYMNEHFVCVKVDREERPDIDQIYMDAAHIISGRGGWPLNVVTLPDGRPFYAATYFPLHQWLNVLQQLHAVYENDQSRVLKAAASITKGIESHPFSEIDVETHFSKESYYQSFENHIQNVDFEWGGYRKAPKFMMPVGLEFFLQYHFLTGNETALQAVTISLDAMAQGGLNDQLGGGFARYSTDEKWLVPHFEKMLYDNAQLIGLYAKTYQITKNSFYKSTIEKTIAFVERELSDECGGFYASIDADSEHEEGKFYVFTLDEITSVLDQEAAQLIIDFYNVSEHGNWEVGKNILHYTTDKEEFCRKHGLLPYNFEILLNNANQQLFNFRSKRIRPTTDDKIVCSWNALLISGYVSAFKATENENYINSALRTCRFIERELMKNDGSLLRIFKDGKATIDAFLDDYALLAQAFIDIYEVTFDFHWLEQSNSLANFVWSHFSNESRDMFYYTADTAKGLIARKYECSDNVIPASNSVLANVFYQLGILFTNNEYISTAEKMLSRVLNETIEYGSYYANWAMLLGKLAFPDFEVAILGENALEKAREMYRNYLPTVTFAGGIQEQLPLMKNRLVNGKTMIYVCENNSCQLPVEKTENALKTIKGTL